MSELINIDHINTLQKVVLTQSKELTEVKARINTLERALKNHVLDYNAHKI